MDSVYVLAAVDFGRRTPHTWQAFTTACKALMIQNYYYSTEEKSPTRVLRRATAPEHLWSGPDHRGVWW